MYNRPWNFPIAMLIHKIAPVVLAGNTVVAKPSPETPLSSLLVGEILQAKNVFPPGVVNIIGGDNKAGEDLVTHPLVKMISFTGSVEV